MQEHQITVVARFKAAAGKESALRELLLGLIEPTRAEPGCVNYDLHESRERPGEFVFYENFADGSAFETHAGMAYIQHMLKACDDLCSEEPDITTWRMITERQG